MRFNNIHIDREILLTTDLMNTINGGMSKSWTYVEKKDDHYVLNVKVPGVDPSGLIIEIKNNTLFIFHKVSVHNNELYKGSDYFPYSVGLMVIPFDVNIKRIKAEFENNELQVIMPFNEMSDGYYKRISIDHS